MSNHHHPQNKLTKPATQLSVLMCVYNGGEHLRTAVQSILSQSYLDFELVIVDDGSTDDALDEIRQLQDERIVILPKQNTGLTDSLNFGLAYCHAPFIARHDADDVSEPQRFATQLAYLQNNPQIDLIGSSVNLIDDDGDHIGKLELPQNDFSQHNKKNQFVHGSLMIRKSLLDKLKGYRREFVYAQDYDLSLRAQECAQLANLPECLYKLRFGSSRISIDKADQQAAFAIMARTFAQTRKEGNLDLIQQEAYQGDFMHYLPENHVVADNNHVLSHLYLRAGYGHKARQCLNSMTASTLAGRVKLAINKGISYLPAPVMKVIYQLFDSYSAKLGSDH